MNSQEEGSEEKQDDTPQQNLMNEASGKSMEMETLSGKRKWCISLKDFQTVGDLRRNLSKKIGIGKELLWIVDRENGRLYQEETLINAWNNSSHTLLIENKFGENVLNENKDGETDFNRSTAKCRMDCGHLTVAETLFELVRDTLPGTEYVEIKCPLCSVVWVKDDLIDKCKMSEDEQLFLECILKVNEETKRTFRNVKETNQSVSRRRDVLCTSAPNK